MNSHSLIGLALWGVGALAILAALSCLARRGPLGAMPVCQRPLTTRIESADYVVEDRQAGSIVDLVELADRSHVCTADQARERTTAGEGYLTIRLAALRYPTRHAVAAKVWDAFSQQCPEQPSRGGEFDEMGTFWGSERNAQDRAKRQGIDPRDDRINCKGNGVELAVRRSALRAWRALSDLGNGRRSGW